MKKSLLMVLLVLSPAMASAGDELESLLDTKPEAVAKRTQNQLVDTLRSQVTKSTAEQNLFFRYLEEAQWKKALLQFRPAFQNTTFENSSNGQALMALLQFRSGLEVAGVERLFSVSDPKKIHLHMIAAWKDSAQENSPVWDVARVQWKEAWREIFGANVEMKVIGRDLASKRSLADLKAMLAKSPAGSPSRAMVEWNLALAYAMNDQPDESAKLIASLLKQNQYPVSVDLMNLTAARMLYQRGYFEAAIRYDEKVSKSSDYWLEAQEEAGWAFLRKGQPQDALAVSKTLVQPSLAGLVGPEPYFLRAVAQLRVCDYPEVVETLRSFRTQFKERTLALQKVSEDPRQEKIIKLMQKMGERPLQVSELGRDGQGLPRLMTRDERLMRAASVQRVLEKEAQAANELYVLSLAQTGLQGFFDSLKKTSEERARVAQQATFQRVAQLAKEEVAETKKILDKMHIVEAEVIQQVAMASRLSAVKVATTDAKVGSTGAKSEDALVFPAQKEIWFDELSNFKVDVKKGCQVKR